MNVLICCEGAGCNDGLSARDRFRKEFGKDEPLWVTEAENRRLYDARAKVSRSLKVTPHTVADYGTEGMATCTVCGHRRPYGVAIDGKAAAAS